MRNKLVVVFILGLTAVAAVTSLFGRSWVAEALEKGPFVAVIKAEAIPLNVEDPNEREVGSLIYVGGWSLTSENDDIGGFSGLVIEDKGASLVAINDKGDWFTADLDFSADNPFSNGAVHRFEGGGGLLAKVELDAESLVKLDDGYLVSFEQKHRIVQVDEIGGKPELTKHNSVVDLSVMADNGGIEAMARLADGSLFMLAEKGLDQQGTQAAWIVSDGKAETRRFKPSSNYSPTDAATLPNGDVLVLMRYFSQLDGVSMKLMHVTAGEIASGETIVGTELAHLAPPQSVDNMEGMDIVVQKDGTVRIFLISDDNFRSLQRTLFLVFDWQAPPQLTMVAPSIPARD